MNLYDRYVLPPLIDWACGLPVVQRERAQLVPRACGRVLEVGIGTGRNLPFYDRSRVDTLSGVDPGLVAMRRRILARAEEARLPLELLPGVHVHRRQRRHSELKFRLEVLQRSSRI